MAANSDVYAVVDKSKKRRNRSPADKELAEEPVSPIYDMATTDIDYKPVPEKNEDLCAEYSRINFIPEKTNLQQEVELENTNPGMKASKEEPKSIDMQTPNKGSSYKSLACIFPTIIAVITILICIISVASLSAEIAKLKSHNASIQQSPFGQQTEVNSTLALTLLQQIQQNVSDAVRAQSTNYLNTSIDVILSTLGNLMNQLNRSIDQLYQHVNSAIENSSIVLGLEGQLNSTETMYQQLSQNISQLEHRTELLINSSVRLFSCAVLLALSPAPSSGYYLVLASNGSAVRVYCDMTRSCGGVTGGWVRVGYLNMTNSSHQCPSGFTEHSDSNIRTCRRNDTSAGCGSVMMDVPYQYSRVCGRVRAYQVGTTNAFQGRSSFPSLDSNYVDGVSLTRGRPRQHIWTFVSGLQDHSESNHPSLCPCNGGTTPPPAFVGCDYFCESGNPRFVPTAPPNPTVYSDDPLWDGRGCDHSSTCCTFNDPPWFHKQLSNLTTDDIEMRVCTRDGADYANVYIEMVEIYVQ